MKESAGVLIAVLSSALGGGAAVATRFLVDSVDPVTIAAVRFAVDAAGDDHDCRRPARRRGAQCPQDHRRAASGVALALTASLGTAPEGAWRDDLIMAAATLSMALYNVFARPLYRPLERARIPDPRHGHRRWCADRP
jgi:drug/metabolite transporter (DMT)-like permease